MCVSGWGAETVCTVILAIVLLLKNFGGLRYIFYPYYVIFASFTRGIFVPMMHMMNDEDVKGTIIDKGWYAGLREVIRLSTLKHPNT